MSADTRRLAATLLFTSMMLSSSVRAEWKVDETSVAWVEGSQTVWKFSFDPHATKPYFHPLSVRGGPVLTNARPEDHPWHYGLWFSWKYINGANYWEEDRKTGRAEGTTAWTAEVDKLKPNGDAALVMLQVDYTHPSGRTDLKESRAIRISRPSADGSYFIDWRADFIAGPEGALLDRTPMPGEPDGKVNGGYAGLGVRFAPAPLDIAFVTSTGPIDTFVESRARPAAPGIAANFRAGGREAGGIAIISDPANSGIDAPWYIVNNPEAQMRFACAALLAPKPLQLKPGATLSLHYWIVVQPGAWTAQALKEQAAKIDR